MTNIKDKINNIISELEFVKNNIKCGTTMEEFCIYFKLALISKFEQAGVKYDPTLENEWEVTGNNTTDNKKFFAFKKSDSPTEQEILNDLARAYEVFLSYMVDCFGSLNSLTFNIIKIEGLKDMYNFSELIRIILVVKKELKC